MTTEEIAKALVEGCRTGQETANLDRLYAADAVSVEAFDMGNGRETRGLDGLKRKHVWWDAEMVVTYSEVSDPFPHGPDRFAVIFKASGHAKSDPKTWDMEEVAIYTVVDGKIVREEFFYKPDPPEA